MHASRIAECAVYSCILDVTTGKPGNVTLTKNVKDLGFSDFIDSALAFYMPAYLAAKEKKGLGKIILNAVRCNPSGKNTNLGIILLLIPLSAAEGRKEQIGSVIDRMNEEDTRNIAEAISLSGANLSAPVKLPKEIDLRSGNFPDMKAKEMFALSADFDSISQQWVTDFEYVFSKAGEHSSVLGTYLSILSEKEDSLIVRTAGKEKAEEVRKMAESADSTEKIAELDRFLRKNNLNPGTTADLTVAVTFVSSLPDWNKDL